MIDWSTSPTLASNAQNNVTRESSDGGWASDSDHSLEPADSEDDTEDLTVNLLNFEKGDTIFMGITMKHYQQILKLKRRSSKRVVIIINPHLFKPEALERVGRLISNYCNLKNISIKLVDRNYVSVCYYQRLITHLFHGPHEKNRSLKRLSLYGDVELPISQESIGHICDYFSSCSNNALRYVKLSYLKLDEANLKTISSVLTGLISLMFEEIDVEQEHLGTLSSLDTTRLKVLYLNNCNVGVIVRALANNTNKHYWKLSLGNNEDPPNSLQNKIDDECLSTLCASANRRVRQG